MDKYFHKSYVMVISDEYYDAFLTGIGMNSVCRFLAKRSRTVTTLKKSDDNQFELHLETTYATKTQKFTPGEVKEIKYIDGRRFKNSFEFDGNRLIEKQMEQNRVVTIIREFHEKEMLGTIILGDIKTKQKSVFKSDQNSL